MRVLYESNDGVLFTTKEGAERRDKIQEWALTTAKSAYIRNMSLEDLQRVIWGILINRQEEIAELLLLERKSNED